MRKHTRECIAICLAEGLYVRHVNEARKHLLIDCAEGPLFFPKTPSDVRWRNNMRSVARRAARGCL